MRVTLMTFAAALVLLVLLSPATAQEAGPGPLPGIPIEAAPQEKAAITRAFGITLGQPLPLSSKQVQAVSSPGPGLEQYLLLFVPAPRSPFARYLATVDTATRRVAAVIGRSRPQPTERAAWDAFAGVIERLERRFGPGMRLGGGTIWRMRRAGSGIDLQIHPPSRTVQITYADERRLGTRYAPPGEDQSASPK